jgi:protein CpxP
MKTMHRHLLTAGLLAALGMGAIAQTQTPPAAPAGPGGAPHAQQGERGRHDPARAEQFRARMQERMAKRLGELKGKLQITAAQEGAWTTWTTALKPAQFQRPDRAEFERLATPERIDRMRALRAQRNAEMDKRMDATKTFYAALTPDQKKVFDEQGMRFMRGGKGGMHHGRHHHG